MLNQAPDTRHNIHVSAPANLVLQPGETYTVSSDNFMTIPRENREQIGLGFPAYLKAVVNPEPGTQGESAAIAVFELDGDADTPIPLVEASGEKRNVILQPKGRKFFVASQKALEEIHRASKAGDNTGLAFPTGETKLLGEGDSLIVGREQGNFASKEMSGYVSRRHCIIHINPNSEVVISDHSTNGTRVVVPK